MDDAIVRLGLDPLSAEIISMYSNSWLIYRENIRIVTGRTSLYAKILQSRLGCTGGVAEVSLSIRGYYINILTWFREF